MILNSSPSRLDDEDVSQLRSYASAIVNDESFAQPNVKWDFWLVGNETTRIVDEQRRQPHLPFGVVQDSVTYRIVVKQWSELISDAEHRLKFVQKSSLGRRRSFADRASAAMPATRPIIPGPAHPESRGGGVGKTRIPWLAIHPVADASRRHPA